MSSGDIHCIRYPTPLLSILSLFLEFNNLLILSGAVHTKTDDFSVHYNDTSGASKLTKDNFVNICTRHALCPSEQ